MDNRLFLRVNKGFDGQRKEGGATAGHGHGPCSITGTQATEADHPQGGKEGRRPHRTTLQRRQQTTSIASLLPRPLVLWQHTATPTPAPTPTPLQHGGNPQFHTTTPRHDPPARGTEARACASPINKLQPLLEFRSRFSARPPPVAITNTTTTGDTIHHYPIYTSTSSRWYPSKLESCQSFNSDHLDK